MENVEKFCMFMRDVFDESVCTRLWGQEIGHSFFIKWCAYRPDDVSWFMSLDGGCRDELLSCILDYYGNES